MNRPAGIETSDRSTSNGEMGHSPVGATDGSSPPACEYCGRRFANARLLALHWGHRHDDRLTASQRDAYRAAYESESETLRQYRIKAVAALVVLYFGFLFAFALFG